MKKIVLVILTILAVFCIVGCKKAADTTAAAESTIFFILFLLFICPI